MPNTEAADVFRRHLVDLSAPDAIDVICARLRDAGIVTVAGLASRTKVLHFAKRTMDLAVHRDNDSDQLTTIRHLPSRVNQPQYAGFGTAELAPHTEGTAVPHPPRLILLVCGTAATTGGESVLADGRDVYDAMREASPEATNALAQPRTAYFGNGEGHPTQVFTRHHDGRVSVRLRTDALARWSPLVQQYLPHLRKAVTDHQVVLALKPGQGYLIDNARWLHARRAFTSERILWRALGEPRFLMPHGFTSTSAAQVMQPRVLEVR